MSPLSKPVPIKDHHNCPSNTVIQCPACPTRSRIFLPPPYLFHPSSREDLGFHLDIAFWLSPYKDPALVHNAHWVNPTWNPGHLFCISGSHFFCPLAISKKLQDKHWVQWERNHKKLQFLQSFVFPLQKLNMFSVWMLMLSSERDYLCRIWAFNFQRNGYSALISSHSYFGSEVFASPIQSPRKASFATPLSKGLSKQRLLRRSLKNTIVTKGIWASL